MKRLAFVCASLLLLCHAADASAVAVNHGSIEPDMLDEPVVGISETPSGLGYWLVAADGSVFPFGDAQDHGSEVNGWPDNQASTCSRFVDATLYGPHFLTLTLPERTETPPPASKSP